MADLSKVSLIKNMTGLNQASPKSQIMASGPDNVPAVAVGPTGQKAPAMIKSGEIIFSIPSIIGAGNGDYDKGSQILNHLHDRLKAMGEELLQKSSLGGLPNDQNQGTPQE